MASVYLQNLPNDRRAVRAAMRSPIGARRMSPKVADDGRLRELADRLGVGVEDAVGIVRDVFAPLAEELERGVARQVEARVGGEDYRRRERYGRAPIAESVGEWAESKRGRGVTAKHAADSRAAVLAAAGACGWRTLTDCTRSGAEGYLAGLRDAGRAPRTLQRVRNNLRDFGRWVADDGRVRRNPFTGLAPVKIREADRTRTRRSLTEAELGLLLGWLDSGQAGELDGLPAATRAACYALTCDLGLRRGEAAGLVAADFDLEAGTLRVRAALCKTGRGAELPLRAAIAERLGPVVAAAGEGVVFALRNATAAMVRADLAAARAWWIGSAGDDAEREARERSDTLRTPDRAGRVVDFHALRVTAATRLARAGVAPAIAMRVLRHSSYSTTAGYYVKADAADLAGAVGMLGGAE